MTDTLHFPAAPTVAEPRTALIIGATGAFGGHAAIALLKRGWKVRALARNPEAAAAKAGPAMPIEWIEGDAMNAADVIAAADGAAVIVHAANPPAYHNWRGLVRQMLAATLAAAMASGARIVLPGNVYNYAADAGPLIGEDARQRPVTRKGKIRVEMEETLARASHEGVRSLIIRAGDFFGPGGEAGWLSMLLRRGGGKVKGMWAPGPGAVGHAFAYLPDLGEATARLIDREAELADFEVFHFAGHWFERMDGLYDAVRRAAGLERISVLPFYWPVIWALSPAVEACREVLEMRYLWQRPIGLDGAKLSAFLGETPHTPLDTALRNTLGELGCGQADHPAEVDERGPGRLSEAHGW